MQNPSNESNSRLAERSRFFSGLEQPTLAGLNKRSYLMTFRAQICVVARTFSAFIILTMAGLAGTYAYAADEPDLIFRRSTVFNLLTPNDKLATYGVDDPEIEGIACHFTAPEKGGIRVGWGWQRRSRIFRWPVAKWDRFVSRKR
jgi:hypothetical protein